MITYRELSLTIRALHRALLNAVAANHAALHGATRSPYELLRLTEEDPLFAWLRPLTAALAELDDAADDHEQPERVWQAVDRVQALVDGADAGFTELYRHHLHSVPDVAVEHGRVRQALRALGRRAA